MVEQLVAEPVRLDNVSVERVVTMVGTGQQLEVRIGPLEPGSDVSQAGVFMASCVVRQIATVARSALAESVGGKRESGEADRAGGCDERVDHARTCCGRGPQMALAATAIAPSAIST